MSHQLQSEPVDDAPVILGRGQAIGRFVVLDLVGRGGMGEVYAAYDPELDRKVAIKLLRARGGDRDPEGREPQKARLLREAQSIAKLQHPNVVVVYDVGTFGDSVFIAMEFVEGQTVAVWLRERARSHREVLDVYLAAGRGLAAAHAAGLVHRDFKPDNVMVTSDGQVRVMDFGLARRVADGPGDARDAAELSKYLSLKLTQTGAMMGTPAYMAPEQFAAAATDPRTDQFSYCVALYEALATVRPFAGDSLVALMTSVATGTITPPPAKAAMPMWLRKVLLRGLATEPEARFPSMTALLAALQTDPTVRTRRLVAAALGLAVLAAAGGVGRRVLRDKPPPPALCGGGAERLAGAWGPPGAPSPRRAAVQQAFQATRNSSAGQAFAAAARYLDKYAGDWLRGYQDACEATRVRGVQSTEVMDLRMVCLEDRLVELRAVTNELAAADDKVVQNAVSGVSSLSPIERCADVRLLRTLVRPPSEQATRRRVQELQGLKAKMFASTLGARCKVTRAIEKDVLGGARAANYPPLLAETLLACGKVEDTCGGRGETLAGYYQEAFNVALSSGHDQVAAESAALFAATLARERQVASARQWHTIGRSIVTRIGGTPYLEIALDQAEGLIAQREHDERTSLAALERARIATAKLRGADHPYVGLILNAEGVTLHGADKDARALEVLRNAELMLWSVVGADHPWVATVLANEGEVLNALHRYVEARAAFEMATTIWTKEKAEPARMASAETGLGIAFLGEGKPRDALAPLESALAARADRTTAPELVGETRFALARALWADRAQRARADSLARAARSDYASAGGDAVVTSIDAWLRGRSPRR